MKRIFVLLLVSVFVLTAATVFATIANTKHNLTTSGSFTRTTNNAVTMCQLCHIPHGGNTDVAGLPIWSRLSPVGPFTPYGGGLTLNNTVIGQPGTFSLTCLSCHDGSVGIGTISKNGITSSFAMTTTLPGGLTAGGAFQATNITATGYSPFIGKNLQNDHPVGFVYVNPGGGIPGIDIPITPGPPRMVGDISGRNFPLFGGTNRFECATCHDPHLEDFGTAQTKFLRAPNAQICQDCHNTK